MLRSMTKLGFTIPFLSDSKNIIPKFDSSQYDETLRKETGYERIRQMFTMDDFGNFTPELNSILQAAFTAGFVGGCYGGAIHSRTAYLSFIENNQATAFRTTFEAKKQLQNKVTISFGKGAFKWGWRLALFTTSYCGISTVISVYRGKSSISEYSLAGLITGAAYKATLGFRGIIVGGGLGLILGTIAGSGTLLCLRLSGSSMEEVRYWQYYFKSVRIKANNHMAERYAVEKKSPLIDSHDARLSDETAHETVQDELWKKM